MTVLTVNGEPIEETAIEQQMATMLEVMTAQMDWEDPQVLRTRAREWAEENLIEAALLRQVAMSDPEPVQDCSPENEVGVRLERLIARVTARTEVPVRKDIVAFYRKNMESFRQPERIHAAHIVKNIDEQNSSIAARAAIELASAELAKGRSFAEVAEEFSDCAGKGGDLGKFERGHMVAAFDDVVFHLDTKQVSGIFRTEFGLHIAILLERFPAGIRPLSELVEEIGAHLHTERKQHKLHEYLDQLRAGAEIRREKRLQP